MMYGVDMFIDKEIQKGEKKGEREGERKSKIEISKNLIKMGLTNSQISEATKLKISEIEHLRDNQLMERNDKDK